MKAPRFWYPHPDDDVPFPTLWPLLLSPFARAFSAGAALRRAAAINPYRAHVPVICVGNVVAGGAGKTPLALVLARLLREQGERPVFVTRGYGGALRSTYVDVAVHDVGDVGDEALLLAASAPTWTGRDRVTAIRQAESHGSVVITDDGMQNPFFKPSVTLLVVDGDVGIGNGHVIPSGPLREPFADALARAQAMIIIGPDTHKLAGRSKIPVFYARFVPNLPFAFPAEGRFVAFAGIGRPEKFYATARAMNLGVVETVDFPDHHMYSQNDIDLLRLRAEEQGARLLTTEKDAVRLPPDFRADVITLPVTLAFANEGDEDLLLRLCFSLSA